MNECYLNNNGGCEEPDNFYPVTATVNGEAVGHLILRYRGEDKSEIRFGFVIVDDTKRGQGYGKKMLLLAEKYAFEILKAETITLGVFENNPDAFYCYQAAGFERLSEDKDFYFDILGEKWKCIEMEIRK
jgi:RimJ/RimL family protein N-acetyltransferase